MTSAADIAWTDPGTPTHSPAARRRREELHFTAPTGWINDPHGICWSDGQYHLFYQHNPDGPHWVPECSWGHAVSTDLIRWEHRPTALAPRSDERGCWSGCTMIENGRPTIVYTSIESDQIGHGRIALAHPDNTVTRWTSVAEDIVIDGPPADLAAQHFRDPYTFPTNSGWTMIVGAGTGTGTALAAQYTSTDARHWTYTGILCSRAESETDGVWTGAVWECPQLIRIGTDWALIVSVWQNHQVHYVAGAVGTYDGTTFVPERWARLTHDDCSYAMTSFRDNQQRPCVMSWLREAPEHDADSSSWAGSLSLPAIIEISPERTLSLRPHPNLAALRAAPATHSGPVDDRTVEYPEAGGLDIELTLSAGGHTEVVLQEDDRNQTRIVADARLRSVVVDRADQQTCVIPTPSRKVRIILDTDLVEIYGGAGAATFRTGQLSAGAVVTIDGSAAGICIFHVTPADRQRS